MDDARKIIIDIETNGLHDPDTVWCVCLSSTDGTYRQTFTIHTGYDELLALAKDHSIVWIGHNIVGYDLPVLERLLGFRVPRGNTLDTLVMSRLLWQGRPDGHSLESWGVRFKFPKTEFNRFDVFSQEMVDYCENDVELNRRLYNYLTRKMPEDRWKDAIDIEMFSAYWASDMSNNGVYFDIDNANTMLQEVSLEADRLREQLQVAFPPVVKITQLKTKVKEEVIPFNPGSPQQVIDRLHEAGWSPVEKTKGHVQFEKKIGRKKSLTDEEKKQKDKFDRYGWKVNERNLETLPDDAPPACALLVRYLLVSARCRTLTEWIENYNYVTGRIHGRFDPLGTRTHRCAHSKPNMGNIPTSKTIKYKNKELADLAIAYGGRMRSMWIAPQGARLVGVDMEGAHLRIFAHLIDDEEFTKALISGKKEDGTDAHTMNMNNLDGLCPTRDLAKTFIFTFLNGGGAGKVSEIFHCSKNEAQKALDKFIQAYPGLKFVKEKMIPDDALRGYFVGVDGRLVVNDSAHLMMGMYLQNMESVLMKYTAKMIHDQLSSKFNFKFVNWVHDEFLFEVYEDEQRCEEFARLCAECIKKVGEQFNLRCPLSGEYKVGNTWLDVH